MKLFLARYEGLGSFFSAAGSDPEAVGTVLSDLMRLIWPGCESAIDGSKNLEIAAQELSPVFLQFGGRPVDFIIHAETANDDLRLLFKELGIPKDITRPRLLKKPERAPKQQQEAVQETVMKNKKLLQAFCTVYAVDFLCMGYEAEFEQICGSAEPARITVRTPQLKEALDPKVAEPRRTLVHVPHASCNMSTRSA
jgi:hypothetical protein